MAKLTTPLTAIEIKSTKPREKKYKLGGGRGQRQQEEILKYDLAMTSKICHTTHIIFD